MYQYIYPYLCRFHTSIINYNTYTQKQQQQSSIFIFHSFHIHIIHIIQSSNTPLTHPLPRTSITQYINTIILISTYINHITQYSSSISLSYSIILLSQITTYPSLQSVAQKYDNTLKINWTHKDRTQNKLKQAQKNWKEC